MPPPVLTAAAPSIDATSSAAMPSLSPAPLPQPANSRPLTLILLGILLVALNLRAAITSLGALLTEVSTGLHMSGTVAGLITTLPAVSFALFGAFTPWLARRFSHARILVGAMVLLAVGQALRIAGDSTILFVATSAIALAGIAIANVLLPVLVREYFPQRSGLITGVYTMTLIAGTTAASAASVPVANAFGGWRAGLGVWSLLALVALLPWLRPALKRASGSNAATRVRGARVRIGRTRLGWAMAIYFGTQSLSGYALMGWLSQIFRDASFTPTNAGLLLAGVTAIGVPIALLMPTLANRRGDVRSLVAIMSAAMMAAYLGLALAPGSAALLWVTLLAIGQGAFPLALAMIGMRARTAEGTVALSAFAQSTGYLIAALGPLLVGVLHELTGGWMLPIGFLLVAAVIQLIAGLFAARPRYVEDEQPARVREI